MNEEGRHSDRPCSAALAEKKMLSRTARKTLRRYRTKVDSLEHSVARALLSGSLPDTNALEQARIAVRDSMDEAQEKLWQLNKSGIDEWRSRCVELNDAWDRLHRSISNLASRFDDERRNLGTEND